MRDRRHGTVLVALGAALLVLAAGDLDLGAWPSRVELALAGLAIVIGLVLVFSAPR